MTALDIFALIVLLVLIAAVVAIWVILGMMPGRIARQRGHPQAEAINVCGWWGVITLGILLPVAWIWAYTKPLAHEPAKARTPKKSKETASEETAS